MQQQFKTLRRLQVRGDMLLWFGKSPSIRFGPFWIEKHHAGKPEGHWRHFWSTADRPTMMDLRLVSHELDGLKDPAAKSRFDLIGFWVIDFNWREGKPFEPHWQAFRTRKYRSLPTVSDFGCDRHPKKGALSACVKVVTLLGAIRRSPWR